jgi:Uri superfamily endonuclease
MERIEQSLEELHKKIDILLEKNKNVEEKITTHIDFIEKTYSVLCRPLNFMKNKIECIMGVQLTKELPSIKNNE